jgi:hypothetical protein
MRSAGDAPGCLVEGQVSSLVRGMPRQSQARYPEFAGTQCELQSQETPDDHLVTPRRLIVLPNHQILAVR